MEKRRIGNSALHIAPLVFGGNVFGWTVDEKISFELLDAFNEAGFNCIDTADSYSRWAPGNHGGESESIIGKWMKEKANRDKIIISTKVGADMGQGKKDLSRKHILHSVEASLQRLQTDYIDLYQSHYDDVDTPVEETLETYSLLIQQGKVRTIGASNFTVERLAESFVASDEHDYPKYECLQPLYNLYEREGFEKNFKSLCEKNNIGVICYYALASGFLSGKYRSEDDLSKSARGKGIKKYLTNRGFRILHALDEAANQYHATAAGIALAWLMARPAITAPIASATNEKQLQELINATSIQLDITTIEKLNEASAHSEVKVPGA